MVARFPTVAEMTGMADSSARAVGLGAGDGIACILDVHEVYAVDAPAILQVQAGRGADF